MPDHLIAAQFMRIAEHSRRRRALHDDEYLPPMPIHGSARMFDRVPLAQRRDYTTLERLELLRWQMSPEGALCLYPAELGYVNTSNPEEGA